MGAALKNVFRAALTDSALGQGRDTEAPSPGRRSSAAFRLGLIQMRSLIQMIQMKSLIQMIQIRSLHSRLH